MAGTWNIPEHSVTREKKIKMQKNNNNNNKLKIKEKINVCIFIYLFKLFTKLFSTLIIIFNMNKVPC